MILIKKLLLLLILTIGMTFANNLTVLLKKSDNSSDDSNITVVITNNTSSNIKLLKWNTIFEKPIAYDLFKVTNLDNNRDSEYIGIKIKRGKPKNSDYILLKPNKKYITTIVLSKYYKIDESGLYNIKYQGYFNYIIEKNSISNSEEVVSNVLRVNIDASKNNYDYLYNSYKTENYKGCSEAKISQIKKAYLYATTYAQEAKDVLQKAFKPTNSPRYRTWFGSFSSNRQNLIIEHFSKIYEQLDTENIKYSCECNEDGVYAYVNPYDITHKINLCPAFWEAGYKGTDSKAGTIIHEMSHFNDIAKTDDIVYGQYSCKNLAKSKPDKAVINADTHEYFAENNPKELMNPNFKLSQINSEKKVKISNLTVKNGYYYTIYRNQDRNEKKVKIATLENLDSFIDNSVEYNKKYFYYIKACSEDKQSCSEIDSRKSLVTPIFVNGKTKAELILPRIDVSITSSTVTFEWRKNGARKVKLYVKNLTKNKIIYRGYQTGIRKIVNNIPTNGDKVRVVLYSYDSNNNYMGFKYYDYNRDKKAELLLPNKKSSITSSTVTFEWRKNGARKVKLYVKNLTKNKIIYRGYQTGVRKIVNNMPTNGDKVRVVLYSYDSNNNYMGFKYYDYKTKKFNKAELIKPRTKSILDNTTVTFEWRKNGARKVKLYVKNLTKNKIIYRGYQTGVRKIVNNMPTNGDKVRVVLYSYDSNNNYMGFKYYDYKTQ